MMWLWNPGDSRSKPQFRVVFFEIIFPAASATVYLQIQMLRANGSHCVCGDYSWEGNKFPPYNIMRAYGLLPFNPLGMIHVVASDFNP